MEEVARAAGISRATLFRRYPSRAALVADLCERAVDAFVNAVDAARPEDGPPADALWRVVGALADLAPQYGLMVLQPLDDLGEAALLDRARAGEQRLHALVLRAQRTGAIRVDLPAEWVTTAVTWLVVGAADGLRLGRLAPAGIRHLVVQTVMGAVTPADPAAGSAPGSGAPER